MSDVWDDLWSGTTLADSRHRLELERRSVRFGRILAQLRNRLGAVAGARVVELGAGPGTTAIALAGHGAHVTLVDRASRAVEAATALARDANVDATVVTADLFSPPSELEMSFDVAMSFGVAEHFVGAARAEVIAAHLRWVRPSGAVIVAVPNALCPSYRAWKWWLERTGRWRFGDEQPFTPVELARLVRRAGGHDPTIFGSSAIGDLFRFATPMAASRLTRGRLRLPELEIKSPLDPFLGYSLTIAFNRPR